MGKEYSIECIEKFTGIHEVKLGDGHIGHHRSRNEAEWAVLFHLRARMDKIAAEINDRNRGGASDD